MNLRHWKLTVGLGLVASIMNDVFYGLLRSAMTGNYDLGAYYSNWLIPKSTVLFDLNLGFASIQVQSWMMAASIYLRFAVIFIFLEGWKYLTPNMHFPGCQSLKKQRISNSKSRTQTEI
jgi:hypothetical protein